MSNIGQRSSDDDDKGDILSFFKKIHDLYDPGKEEFSEAVEVIQKYYKPGDRSSTHPDYGEKSMRCGYIFKYAAVHAALIRKVILEDLPPEERDQIFANDKDEMNICCLGAAACSDLVGMLVALSRLPQCPWKTYKFTSIDIVQEWKHVHDQVKRRIEEGKLSIQVNFESGFVCDDVLALHDETANIVRSSDVITMLKFMSELRDEEIPTMLEKVLRLMKPGAVLIFVDNSGGGFYEAMDDYTSRFNLERIVDTRRSSFDAKKLYTKKYNYNNLYKPELSVLSVTIGVFRRRLRQETSQ